MLDYLEREGDPEGTPAQLIAYARAGREPTVAEVESIRRAIRTLAEQGLVEAWHFQGYAWRGVYLDDTPTTFLAVRLPRA